MFEYAASYPTEAESSLRRYRGRLKHCFSFLFGKADRALIDQETSISATPEGSGYHWEIQTSPLLLAHMKKQADEKLSDIDPETIALFKAFDALADDTPGSVIEFCSSFDSDSETIYEMRSQYEGKTISSITGSDVRLYDTWNRFKEWL